MLGILIIIGICVGFYKLGEANGRKGWIYALLSVVIWFGAQFIAGIFIGLLAPEMLNEQFTIIILGLASSAAGVGIFYLLLKQHFNKNPKDKNQREDILDN